MTQPWLHTLKTKLLHRTPLLLQTEAAECGLMCVAMVAGFYGDTPQIAFLRREYRVSMRGANMEQLMRMGAALKMSSRALRVDVQDLKQLPKPCILHWDAQHYVVLVKTNWRGAVVHDPAQGVRTLSWQRMAEHFSGAVLELTPTHEFTDQATQPMPKMEFKALVGRVVGLKTALWQMFALGLGIEAIVLLTPLFMQWVTDHALVTGDIDLLMALVFGFAGLLIIRTFLEALRSWVVALMSTWFNVQWTANIFSHLLRLPVLYYQKQHMGDIISRFSVIGHIQNTLTVSFIAAILDGLMAVGMLTMLMLYSITLAGIIFIATIIYALLRIMLIQVQRRLSFEMIAQNAKQDSVFMETMRAMPTVRAHAHEPVRVAHWMNLVVNTKNTQLQQMRWGIVFKTSQGLLGGLAQIAIVGLGATAIMKGEFSIGMLLAFSAYAQQFGARSMSFIDRISELRLLEVQGIRLLQIVHQKPEEDPSKLVLPPVVLQKTDVVNPSLEARDLRFKFETADTAVLLGTSFKLERGKLLVIEGAPGSGKSTLIHALLGFYPMMGGEVWLHHAGGSASMQKIGLSNYRNHIGAVLSQDTLLAGSIAENISMFSPEPDMNRIEACSKVVGLDDDIVAMPMRYFTVVGDMGNALSGGQRDKLIAARALHRSCSFLILDEPFQHIGKEERNDLIERFLSLGFGLVLTCQVGQAPPCVRNEGNQMLRLHAGKLHAVQIVDGEQPIKATPSFAHAAS